MSLQQLPTVYGGQEIDPITGLPVPPVDPTMGMPAPAAAPPGLLGKLGNALGGSQGLLTLGANLMAAGGPSPVRTTFGQALGPALLAAQQQKTQTERDMLQAMLLKTKIAAAGQTKQTNSQKDYEYAKATGFKGSFEEWKRVASAQPNTPAAIQQYEYWKSLPTQKERDEYLTVQRNMQPYQLVDYAGGKGAFNRATAQMTPVTTAAQEAEGAAQIAQGTATGKATGETTTAAKFDLPRVEDNARVMFDLLDRLEKHPGRAAATGASSAIPLDKLPGTDARDFVSILSRVGGQQFLEAYNTLKGGGQITEVEGKKAETAISTIQDRGQSEGAYLQAINDLREVVNLGLERARKKANGGQLSPTKRSREEILKQYGIKTGA